MSRHLFWVLAMLLAPVLFPASAAETVPLTERPWFETRTAHFHLYSCGQAGTAFLVATQLEQFCEAYSLLAGAQAVASPPIVVLIFPDHESLKPFLPLYHGQPANLAAFFQHGSDENLIVLSVPAEATAVDMSVIFHEYTHLLLRRNDGIWPLWLKEGMAELYSTFNTSGYNAVFAEPIAAHVRVLAQQPLLPLADLFAVGHDSPQYNERDRQGIFYAESWLLTHFLVAGDNAGFKARFRDFTPLLQTGQTPVQAFTNALRASLPAVQAELQRYLAQGEFPPFECALRADVTAAKPLAARPLTPVEIYFRLGDELLRIQRYDEAEKYFNDARKRAPASPLPYEGLGLVALRREQSDEAIREFQESIRRGSASYLTHYFYAWEKFRLAANAPDGRGLLTKESATELHAELLKSILLMPTFGRAHELFGIVELARGEDAGLAEKHLALAVELEPENPAYLLALADAQLRNGDADAARRSLSALLLPTADAQLRTQAGELLKKINRAGQSR
jgi:tetratricopeptide (TPR) repeat protein